MEIKRSGSQASNQGPADWFAAPTQLIAAHLVEEHTNVVAKPPAYRGSMPIPQLRKVEDYVTEHFAQEISIERLAELVELSSSHFSHVFKESTGMTPLQFITRQRITHAQRLIRETSRSFSKVGLEVGYTNPSHFAQVFRRVVGVTPTEFRSSLLFPAGLRQGSQDRESRGSPREVICVR